MFNNPILCLTNDKLRGKGSGCAVKRSTNQPRSGIQRPLSSFSFQDTHGSWLSLDSQCICGCSFPVTFYGLFSSTVPLKAGVVKSSGLHISFPLPLSLCDITPPMANDFQIEIFSLKFSSEPQATHPLALLAYPSQCSVSPKIQQVQN